VIQARGDVQVGDRQHVAVALQQIVAPLLGAGLVHHRQAACAEHERHHAAGLAPQPRVSGRDGKKARMSR
jgi:hypothetical protein